MAENNKLDTIVISGVEYDIGNKFEQIVEIKTPDDKEEIIIGESEDNPTIIISEDCVKVKKITDLLGNEINKQSEEIEIICPDTFYAVVGFELNIYYDSLFKALDAGMLSPFGYYVDIQCPDLQTASGNSTAVRRERMWQIDKTKLTSSFIGEHKIYIRVYNLSGEIVAYKICDLIVINSLGFTTSKNILCIGDSLTAGGLLVKTCKDNFSTLTGTVPNFIGTRKSSDVYHEGYPGYTFSTFTKSTGGSYVQYIFQVPIATQIYVNDIYELSNGNQYKITDIRTETDTTTSLRCSLISGSVTPPTSGILTKVSGNSSSDSTINYSDYNYQNGNPFWNNETSKIDFTNYLNQFNIAGQLDCVVIMLGTNDSIGSISSSLTSAKKIITAILEDSPNCKIILQLTPADANTISSWQVYADSPSASRKIHYWDNYWELRKQLYNEFTKDEWKSNVRIGQTTMGIDRYYGYGYTSITSSYRISNIQEIYHTNSVHPSTSGYQQIGDGYFLDIMGTLN